MKIGFFDSGLGGLVVMKAVRELLPQYDYVFFGDTANLPFGDKTEEEIFELTRDGVERLFEEDCALVVMTSSFVSAKMVARLQQEWVNEEYLGRQLIDCITPVIEEVLDCEVGKIVLIAPQEVVSARSYEEVFYEYGDSPQLVSLATPLFVPLIEAGKLEEGAYEVKGIIDEAIRAGADGLIFGCTHYALLRPLLQDWYQAEPFMLFSPDQIIPKKVFRYLNRHAELTDELTLGGTVDVQLSQNRTEYQVFLSTV